MVAMALAAGFVIGLMHFAFGLSLGLGSPGHSAIFGLGALWGVLAVGMGVRVERGMRHLAVLLLPIPAFAATLILLVWRL